MYFTFAVRQVSPQSYSCTDNLAELHNVWILTDFQLILLNNNCSCSKPSAIVFVSSLEADTTLLYISL